MRADRLLLSGAMTLGRTVRRAEGWLLSAFAIGGAIGFAYHLLAPALVAGLQSMLLWWCGQ